MNIFKAQKAYLVSMVIVSVFMSSSLVYGDSGKPGESVSFEALNDEAETTSQGIIRLVNGMSGIEMTSALVTGYQDSGEAIAETPAPVRTANDTIRLSKAHSGSVGCQESCSLN